MNNSTRALSRILGCALTFCLAFSFLAAQTITSGDPDERQNAANVSTIKVTVSSYNFYLARQGAEINDRFYEVNGIITYRFPEITIKDKAARMLIVKFISAGSVSRKAYHNPYDKSWNIEMPGADLAAWVAATGNAGTKYLDIQDFGVENRMKVYLGVDGQ